MILTTGTVVGERYKIEEKIGTGGMAYVYKARDTKLERYVTLKVLKEEYAEDEHFKARFSIEARSAAKLSHPNIVNAYDFGEENGICYIVMEYIEGETLKQIIVKRGPLDEIAALNISVQMASALSHAHKNGVVHRDIKPQNILVSVDGTVKITDFGIARAVAVSTVTTTSNAMGSVYYFSPEQARGGYVDEKSDIYSMGITMFEMVTGRIPFDGRTSVAIALKHLNDPLPDIRKINPRISKEFCSIIEKAAAKKKDDRYATADLLLEDLRIKFSEITVANNSNNDENAKEEAKPIENKISQDLEKTRVGAAVIKNDVHQVSAPQRPYEENVSKGDNLINLKNPESSEQHISSDIPYISNETPNIENITRRTSVETPENINNTPEYAQNNERNQGENVSSYSDAENAEGGRRKIELPETAVNFDKYSNKFKISKQEEKEFEKTFVEKTPMPEPPRKKKKEKAPKKTPKRKQMRGDDIDDESDDESYKKNYRKVVIAAVITAVILIFLISLFGTKLLTGGSLFAPDSSSSSSVSTSQEGTVPNFVGMNIDAAKTQADKIGITIVIKEEKHSSEKEGTIIEQDAENGTAITAGQTINVVVSSGNTAFQMPNVVYKTEEEALELIKNEGGATPEIRYETNEEVPEGVVIEQKPAAQENVTSTTTIVLTVSKGNDVEKIKVPNFENSSIDIATKEAEALDLKVGTITNQSSDTVDEGKVIKQSIPSGTEVEKETTITFTVSSGKAEEKPEEPEEKPEENTEENKTSTLSFSVDVPTSYADANNISIKMLKIVNGSSVEVVYNGTLPLNQFPFTISVTGSGTAEIQLYVDNVFQWNRMVNFSEGTN